MTSSLVGSEMCIRDSENSWRYLGRSTASKNEEEGTTKVVGSWVIKWKNCLLYTSDAADDM
eukprot:5051625-Prorocentrum_lima.AAC.1